ncbi:hypothetical protein C9374_005037 [Naegleria lovaniensis]|uniref:F-box domain-containing protein n=1 Tax=Naegleria lovaniensis TaxID=51637 RepID=A0AA88KIQ0_NAELO|nr:uncharacterized protein C9374_005037 [Naegleria lovaniensis]KAG2382457.1 hypothetical protein C9374_005037 [Naegleria lovaniensis]
MISIDSTVPSISTIATIGTTECNLLQLPVEVWMHIFSFLEFENVKKTSLKISAELADHFLNDENELFYRLFCYFELKQDLQECLDTILNRHIYNEDRNPYFRRGQTMTKLSFSSHPKSMSQLRSMLRKKVERINNLFPELYQQMEEQVTQALKKTYFGGIQIEVESIENGNSQMDVVNQKIAAKNFTLKSKRRIPKWKTICTHLFENHHYRNASHYLQILANMLRQCSRRSVTYRSLRREHFYSERTDIIRKTLHALKLLQPRERHELMFKTYTFTPKFQYRRQPYSHNLKSGLFHTFVFNTYSLLTLYVRIERSEFVEACSEFILYFLSECENQNPDILIEQLIPNNCALMFLMRIRNEKFEPTVLTILRNYAKTIRQAPKSLLFRIFTCALKFNVPMAYIRELFEQKIITKELLSMDPPPTRKKLNIFQYAMTSASRWVYYDSQYYYYSDVFNLIISTLDGKPIPKSLLDDHKDEGKNDPKKLRGLVMRPKSKVCCALLETISSFKTYNEHATRFHQHLQRYFKEEDPFYWDECVAFERPKFGNI